MKTFSLKKTFASLKHRNFRLYFFGQLISNTGNWLTNVALILLVLKLTHSGLAVGLLAACQYGPILLLAIWGGVVADRLNKHHLLIATQTLEMLQSIGLAVLAFMPHPPLAGFYMLAVAGGIFLAFDNPVRRSFVSEMVPPEDIPNAVVLYGVIVNGSRIFGPALAGLLVTTVGFGWCFGIDAVSYVAVIGALFMMRPAELYVQEKKPRGKNEIREGLRYVMSLPSLWISFAMLAVIGTLAFNFAVTVPLLVINTLGGSAKTFTILYAVYGAGSVVCALATAHMNLFRLRHIIFGAGVLGIVMLFLAASPSVLTAGVMMFFLGVATVLYMNPSISIIQVEAKPEMHGRVLALQTVLLVGTTPLGGPLVGWLADLAGARVPIFIGAISCLVAAILGYFASKYYSKRYKIA